MGFITKLKSAFGNSKTDATQSNNDSLEAIMAAIEHEPFAVSETNVLYAGLNELGGYYSFQTVICGNFKVKTKNGSHLHIMGKTLDLKLNSESLEFESDPTDVKGRSITKIDFQIEESDAAKIDPKHIHELRLTCKAYDIIFKTLDKK